MPLSTDRNETFLSSLMILALFKESPNSLMPKVSIDDLLDEDSDKAGRSFYQSQKLMLLPLAIQETDEHSGDESAAVLVGTRSLSDLRLFRPKFQKKRPNYSMNSIK
ncbi:hypothetical protein [Endozoicomonas sp.]|uniref:hypothetical protein n=1 Tax=Endozoicomonas sp. TaxID=1892382 RepID=UPI003D9B53D4